MSLLPRVVFWTLSCLLLTLFCVRVLIHSQGISATFDEPQHLAAGYTYLRYQDYRLNPEHPPLTKKLAALPLLTLQPLPQSLDLSDSEVPRGRGSRSWQHIKGLWGEAVVDYRKEWHLGHELLFGVENSTMERLGVSATAEIDPLQRIEPREFLNDADRMIERGRLPLLIFGVFLSILVLFWARDLWGPSGALLALALCTLHPDVVAHTTLITNDVAAASMILGTVYGLWRFRRFGGWRNATLSLICFALAITAKFSAILLIPIGAVLVAVSTVRLWLTDQRSKAGGMIGLYLLCGLGVLVAVWGAYGFRYSAVATSPAEPLPIDRVLEQVVQQELKWNPEVAGRRFLGTFDRVVSLANRNHWLPEAYLQGLAVYRLEGRVRPSFLNGEYSLRGFRSYFAWTFLFKTPLVSLLVIGGGLLIAVRSLRREDLLYLLLPVVVYFAMATSSYLNIGNRHILPIYPFLFVIGGGVVPFLVDRWPAHKRTIVPVSVFLVALSSFLVMAPPWRPAWIAHRPLEFFNEFAGGPRNGYQHLVNSNLDWGQGLKDLVRWLDENGIDEPINLCYFGTSDPRYYQIEHVRVPCDYLFSPPLSPDDPFQPTIVPGYLAITATHLQGERDTERMRQIRRSALERATLIDRIGNAIFIYRLEPTL